MKVIQIMDNFSVGGGVNSFVYDLCYALKELGCDVCLIGILNMGYENNPTVEKLRVAGIDVECLGAKSKKDAVLHYRGKLRQCIKKKSIGEKAVCNLHLKLSVLMGTLATIGMKNVKCVETYHNTYHHYHLQCWVLYPFIKKYICVSETAKQEMHRRFFLPEKDVVAIPNGVLRKKVREIAKIDEYKKEEGKTHVVSVGRLSYEKNFMTPMKAFVDICNEHLTYTLVGGGSQGAELKAIAKKNKYITMLGAVSRERALQELARADIVVMPSLWEGRSILQLEAMALDKPMILSDVPGLREPFRVEALKGQELYRIIEGGCLVQTNNPEAYREAIYIMTANNDVMDGMKEKIANVSRENDLMKTATKYNEVYNAVWRV